MVNAQELSSLNAEQLRALAKALIDQAATAQPVYQLGGHTTHTTHTLISHNLIEKKTGSFGLGFLVLNGLL